MEGKDGEGVLPLAIDGSRLSEVEIACRDCRWSASLKRDCSRAGELDQTVAHTDVCNVSLSFADMPHSTCRTAEPFSISLAKQ